MKRFLSIAARILAALLIAAFIVLVMVVSVERGRRVTDMSEFVPPNEAAFTASIVASAIESVNYTDPPDGHPPYRRDVHSKSHGCVRAIVEVDPALQPAYRQGVFTTPGRKYQSWIRFSNGNTFPQPDSEGDARGMALKLMGVEGTKLLESDPEADTQDFIMINSPVFFIRNVEEYAKFTRILADGSRLGYFFNQYSWNPLTWRLRDMYLALRTLKKPPHSLLHEQYFSLTAYKFGTDANVKFRARGCTSGAPARVSRDDEHPDFLRDEMKASLASGEGCFELAVQPQVQGKYMPIEDPSVNWSERDSAFVKVATITIEKQAFDTAAQNDFCEALTFSPWHSLPAHRPLGGLNRIRKAVYQEDARYRRAMTTGQAGGAYVANPEPKGWCLDLTGATCQSDPSPR
jgi:catalase